MVSEDFSPRQLSNVRLSGSVEIGSGAIIIDSYIENYSIGAEARIEGVGRLECRAASTFGNGVEVSTINENGGRKVAIYEGLTAQCAYLWAINRHRAAFVERLDSLVGEYSELSRSSMGRVGRGSKIIGVKFIREVAIGDSVTIDGASLLECGTILSGSFVGVDVKAREFIIAEDARLDTGASLERCFVGERAIVASMFSAIDSLIFASSHLENGEAAAIFAGPYTVSHHKSSLLIAGLFSFFNAGSGSNQSNHLFKCGAVHQAIHPRGCKFASGAYVMSPAREGAFTMVKGYHAKHHDTSALPYSYLIDDTAKGRSMLMPAANLTSYGTKRDTAKWEQRDKRTTFRDVINYEEHNPYITGAMVRGVNALHSLSESDEKADEYMWERVTIRRAHLRRGLTLYNKAIAASIGAMLSRGKLTLSGDTPYSGEWLDVAGAYVPVSFVEELMSRAEEGEITQLSQVGLAFKEFATRYEDYAHTYAHALLAQLLGHNPSAEEITQTIEAALRSGEELERMTESDRERDCSLSMAVGYGNDTQDEAIREADFKAVRGL